MSAQLQSPPHAHSEAATPPSGIPLPQALHEALFDPESWRESLEAYAHTTHLAVALVDAAGRLIGECINPQPTWSLLHAKQAAGGGCPFALGPCELCTCVGEALARRQLVLRHDRTGLVHFTVPLVLGDQPVGALLAGQVFDRYPEQLPLEHAAKRSGLPPRAVWQEARLEPPIKQATLHVYGRLLATLGNAFLRTRYDTLMEAHRLAEIRLARDALEQRVQERTVLLALMHEITVAANTLPSLAALQVALDRICACTGWPVGHAYLSATNGSGHWVPTALWYLADLARYAPFQQATQTLQVTPNEGLIGSVGATGTPAWRVDVATDPAFLRQHAAARSGLTTGCAVPLLVEQEVVGVLEFYAEARLEPDAALLDALLQIGTQLGRAVERERAREQAQRQQEALFQREKLASMGSLLASVAHELNNPLATILLYVDLLQEEVGQGSVVALTTELTQAALRCERLVRQFLSLVRQHPQERSAVALNALVTETVGLLAPGLQVDNIAVDVRLDDALPLIWADPHQLQQVVVNLLTNAQQALCDVAAPRQLTITTQGDPGQARVLLGVTDTGLGIPPEIQARIFEPFFTTKPSGVGTGLGLPLCRGIIEEHGGILRVTSHPGQGSTFHVELPVGTAPATIPACPDVAAEPAVRGLTILLVEDEPGIASGLARLLRRDGQTVDLAANGRLALARLQECAYDLILSDVRMPELDGPGLYRILAQQQPHLCQRIIFLTGDTLAPETQTFLEHSGAPCLAKPFTIAAARHAIQQALRAR